MELDLVVWHLYYHLVLIKLIVTCSWMNFICIYLLLLCHVQACFWLVILRLTHDWPSWTVHHGTYNNKLITFGLVLGWHTFELLLIDLLVVILALVGPSWDFFQVDLIQTWYWVATLRHGLYHYQHWCDLLLWFDHLQTCSWLTSLIQYLLFVGLIFTCWEDVVGWWPHWFLLLVCHLETWWLLALLWLAVTWSPCWGLPLVGLILIDTFSWLVSFYLLEADHIGTWYWLILLWLAIGLETWSLMS